jgi:2-dehydropantoate 2-reductase
MREIKKISIIGIGAVGSAYASKLHDLDPTCLTVIADASRFERYQVKPFVVNDRNYSFNYVRPEEIVEYADLIIVSVKFHQLPQAIKDIKNHVGPDTIIISLMNGITSEKQLGEVYGLDKLLYGMVLAIDAERQDTNSKYADTAKIFFGEESNITLSPKVAAVKELFDKASIGYVIPENMIYALWGKFMFNVGINQTSAILKATYKVFQEVKEAEDLLRAAMKEVLELSNKIGIHLKEEEIDNYVNLVKRQSPDSKTSMLQDVEAKRKTEVEMLSGTVCELGQQYGVDTPVNRTLFSILRTMEMTY